MPAEDSRKQEEVRPGDTTKERFFDEVTKGLARGAIPRRQVLKWL